MRNMTQESVRKREVFRYDAEWLISNIAWSNGSGESLRLGISSYLEKSQNKIEIVQLLKDEYNEKISKIASVSHFYPATKIMFAPHNSECSRERNLLATSSDQLQLWSVEEDKLNESMKSESEPYKIQAESKFVPGPHKGPITSFDWCEIDRNIIVSSSVDSDCTVWDVAVAKSSASLSTCRSSKVISSSSSRSPIYDVSFTRLASGKDIFAAVGGDGTVKLLDIRDCTLPANLYSLEASKSATNQALIRVSCNKLDYNLISTFADQSNIVILIDIRKPGKALSKMSEHSLRVNGMSWAPHSARHLCTASDDQQALIWELVFEKPPNIIEEPILAYQAQGRVNSIGWSSTHPDWIGISSGKHLELLRV